MVQVAGIKNVIDWVWYDSVTLGATDTAARMFQTAIGDSGKKLTDTNMLKGGALPGGDRFKLKAIAVHTQPDITKTLLTALLKDGALDFKIGEVSHFQVPLIRLTAGCGIEGMTTGTTVELYHNGQGDPRAVFALENGLDITDAENFAVDLLWSTAPGAVKFWVCLEGVRTKGVS